MSQNEENNNISSNSNTPIDLKKFAREFAGDSPPTTGCNKVELSLGLSLNGCFGTEPRINKITRSSSVSAFQMFPLEGNNEFESVRSENNALVRTCSLPVQTEQEVRKRKEMQSLKRLEAKRKRFEKKTGRNLDENGNCKSNVKVEIASQGSSSSGLSDFDTRSLQAEVRSPPLPLPSNTHANAKCEPNEPSSNKKSCTLTRNRSNGFNEMQTNFSKEIPSVYTKLDGPNGRRIEGFLYKYSKGEEVRIVCVCHGSFLTPAEFVKHAGGGDVAYPLRHIVVNPNPFSFL